MPTTTMTEHETSSRRDSAASGVLMAAGPRDGAAWYRVEVPAQWLRSRGCDVRTCYEAELSSKRGDFERLRTFMASRGCDPTLPLGAMALQDQLGVRVVYDLDDDFWTIPAWNFLAPTITPSMLKNATAMIRLADCVTTPTAMLAEKLERLNPRVTIIPNALPPRAFVPERTSRRTGFRVGWAGSATHVKDLEQVEPALAQLLLDVPDVTLVFMGWTPHVWLDHPRVESRPWVQPPAYYDALNQLDLDVFVAPLASCEFNLAKSPVKLLEAAAQQWPIVCTDFGPYAGDPAGVPAIRVPLDRPDRWYEVIVAMLRDPALRRGLGHAAHRHVERRHTIDEVGPLWVKALGLA